MKKLCLFILCLCFIFLTGCEIKQRMPITVSFSDVSGALSTDHTVKILFAEEKEFENYFVDILIWADKDVELTIFQEFSDKKEKAKIKLNKDGTHISLDEYGVFNLEKEQNNSMIGYSEVLATNLIINADRDANITMLAIIGDNDNNDFKTIGAISKQFTLSVKESKQK